jgi:hypothetical protein
MVDATDLGFIKENPFWAFLKKFKKWMLSISKNEIFFQTLNLFVSKKYHNKKNLNIMK